ncbi:MAG: GDSL-type esterase/lipase family protein [Acidobacteriota bacterium]|nr:GDSL-type esterase/lipase family protein [Acidobacteriota bacterium]
MIGTSRFWLWRLPGVVAAGATILFAGGFWLALRGALGNPIGAPPPPPQAARPAVRTSSRRLLLVLGDSLARGTGDEAGKGFSADVLDVMKKKAPAEIANLSVNGAESAELKELVASANVRSLAASADLILVSIGGNDLSHAVPRGPDPGIRAIEDVSTARRRYAENLRAILGDLRRANPSAPIFLLGLYDPFGDAGPGGRLGASVILNWNTLIEETALSFPATLLIPTFDLFEHRPDRLAADRFHPNRKGYAAIAIRMGQLLPEAP